MVKLAKNSPLNANDFLEFCEKRNIQIIKNVYMTRASIMENLIYKIIPNLLVEEVIFVVTKKTV